jgi:N-acetylneuraminic acid mutarotase
MNLDHRTLFFSVGAFTLNHSVAWCGRRSLSVFACLLLTSCAAQPQWQRRAPLPTSAGGFATGVIDERIVVAGGVDWREGVKVTLDDAWRYEPAADAWSVGPQLPRPTAYAAAAWDAHGIMVVGGTDGIESLQQVVMIGADGSLHVRDSVLQTVYAGAAMGDGWLYVVGGGDSATDMARLRNEVYRVRRSDGHVQTLPDYPGGAVICPAVACSGGRLYVFGGAYHDAQGRGFVNIRSAFAYDLSEKRWHRVRALPAAIRGAVSLALSERWLVIVGGYGSRTLSDAAPEDFSDQVLLYDTVKDRYWSSASLPTAVLVPGLLRIGEYLYVFGGEDQMRQRTDEMYRLRWRDMIPGR